ncbi:MAG: 2-amino-4-hydroxy-6-hydroxymethyldihydropteridine diphosphokinase [Halothiobacillaceae bacterium]
MPLAYIGLGSNLNDPVGQVRRALGVIAALPESRLVAASRLYRSPPMGPIDQPEYINAVAALQTELVPYDLLRALQAIEQDFGRVRLRRWGERVIDLDLLLYDNLHLDSPELILPHPGIGERAFVLCPLAELAPDLVIPGLGPLADLLAARVMDTCEPLEEAA